MLLRPSVIDAKRRLTFEPIALGVWPAAGEAAEGVPGPLAPAVVGDAVGAGHAGGVRGRERLRVDLARADENASTAWRRPSRSIGSLVLFV